MRSLRRMGSEIRGAQGKAGATMTLPALLDRIGWTVPTLARRLGLSAQAVYCWHRGMNARGNPAQPPADVLAWLERVALAVERETPPR